MDKNDFGVNDGEEEGAARTRFQQLQIKENRVARANAKRAIRKMIKEKE